MNEKYREHPLPKPPVFDISEAHKGNSETTLPIGKSPGETMDEMDAVCRQLREVLMEATEKLKA